MADQSAIEWTDATWNPVTGCTRISPGCLGAHCYIERTPPFRVEGRRFGRVGNEETTGVRLHPERLDQPLRWRKPRRVFVCSLADLFHEQVPTQFILEVFDRMACATLGCSHRRWDQHDAECWTGEPHIFQVLTKRPERARAVLLDELPEIIGNRWPGDRALPMAMEVGMWPLPNVWLGVSIENARYTWRADVLRQIPAMVRFISAEPLLGSLFASDSGAARGLDEEAQPVQLAAGAPPAAGDGSRDQEWNGELVRPSRPPRGVGTQTAPVAPERSRGRKSLDLTGIDWLIVGGESGPGARTMNLEWARELVAACREQNVACFVKQLGAKPVGGDAGTWYYLPLRDRKGGDPQEWPEDLRVRETPLRQVIASRRGAAA